MRCHLSITVVFIFLLKELIFLLALSPNCSPLPGSQPFQSTIQVPSYGGWGGVAAGSLESVENLPQGRLRQPGEASAFLGGPVFFSWDIFQH